MCRIVPSIIQLKVCSPMCGCGPMSEPFPGRKIRRARVIEEAPGADRAPVPVRQRAPDLEAVPDDGALRFEPLDVHRSMMLRLAGARNRA